jgi:hypothetical protein
MIRFSVLLCAAACVGSTTDGTDSATPADCERIRTEWQGIYDELVSNTSCTIDDDCHAPYALCSEGLGGCQVAVSTVVSQQDIDDVGAGYRTEAEDVDGDPTTAVCDCYGGFVAKCDQGTCVLAGPYYN